MSIFPLEIHFFLNTFSVVHPFGMQDLFDCKLKSIETLTFSMVESKI